MSKQDSTNMMNKMMFISSPRYLAQCTMLRTTMPMAATGHVQGDKPPTAEVLQQWKVAVNDRESSEVHNVASKRDHSVLSPIRGEQASSRATTPSTPAHLNVVIVRIHVVIQTAFRRDVEVHVVNVVVDVQVRVG